MRLLHAVIAMGALLLAAAAAPTPEVGTRGFEDSGSVGTDSTFEFYLLEGTYHHRLVGITGCHITASVFPSRGEQGVQLSDVIDADLSVGRRTSGITLVRPADSFTITQAGWANIQVGTGADCPWSYSVTGLFLPEGEEPAPPSLRSQWWLFAGGAVVVVGLALLAWRRKPSAPPSGEEKIRVMDGH